MLRGTNYTNYSIKKRRTFSYNYDQAAIVDYLAETYNIYTLTDLLCWKALENFDEYFKDEVQFSFKQRQLVRNIKRFIEDVCEVESETVVRGLDYVNNFNTHRPLSTGLIKLDEELNGGLFDCEVTELAGSSGSGKTQTRKITFQLHKCTT
jgi:hypothetical protein